MKKTTNASPELLRALNSLLFDQHTCITDDGGTPNRPCKACEQEKKPTVLQRAIGHFGLARE